MTTYYVGLWNGDDREIIMPYQREEADAKPRKLRKPTKIKLTRWDKLKEGVCAPWKR